MGRTNKKTRKKKEKAAKARQQEQKIKSRNRQMSAGRNVLQLGSVEHAASCYLEGAQLFPSVFAQSFHYYAKQNESSKKPDALFDIYKRAFIDECGFDSSDIRIFQPGGPYDPVCATENRFTDATRHWPKPITALESFRFYASHAAHVLGRDEWKPDFLLKVKEDMEADAEAALRRASEVGSSNINVYMNLILRYIQSLLASRLGVRLEYNSLDSSDVLNRPGFRDRSTGAVLNMGNVLGTDAQRNELRRFLMHWVACGILNAHYSGCIYKEVLHDEFAGFWGRSNRLVDIESLLPKPTVPMVELTAVDPIDDFRNGLIMAFVHCAHTIRLADMEIIEPLMNGHRVRDYLEVHNSHVAYSLCCLASEGNVERIKERYAPYHNAHFLDLDVSIKTTCAQHLKDLCNFFGSIADSSGGMKGDTLLSIRDMRWLYQGLIEPSDPWGSFPDQSSEERVDSLKKFDQQLRKIALYNLKVMSLCTWNTDGSTATTVHQLIDDIPSAHTQELHDSIDDFVTLVKQNGIKAIPISETEADIEPDMGFLGNINASGLRALCRRIDADGGPASTLVRFGDWSKDLSEYSHTAFQSAEAVYSQLMNWQSSPAHPNPPGDWTPVMVNYANAIEGELVNRPYRHALNMLVKDTQKWPTDLLNKLQSKKGNDRILARAVLDERRGSTTHNDPTLGSLYRYFKYGAYALVQKSCGDHMDNLCGDWLEHIRDHQAYAKLLTPAFIEDLEPFTDYRNDTMHPRVVNQFQALVGRRIAISMLRLLRDCHSGQPHWDML